ncbi:MAG: 2,3-bisphosphoglycerate-independent phosphoglycerate mutase [Pseudomonadota bacterium]|nr:2,3-bisphosphoglycerate-independent phosphoglycerate mutase [Pseudomonadota bacterium]
MRTPHVLIILDGWGHSTTSDSNAILAANTPNWDRLWSENTHSLVSGSGMDVGLPEGQMGNSEVGHMNLGSGRVVYQDFTRISKAIADGDFFTNTSLVQPISSAVQAGNAVHIMGMVSEGGVHSHQEHIFAMIKMAKAEGAQKIYVHAFLDGRDTPPKSAEPSLVRLQAACEAHGAIVASVCGRYFAMDRDNRWERVQPVYEMLTEAKAQYRAASAVEALEAAYAREETDEFVQPTWIEQSEAIQDGDVLVFMNFRADRAREISRAFVQDAFDGFERAVRPKLSNYVMLTQYAEDIEGVVAYPPSMPTNTLGEFCADIGKTQLRIAETEKYAHVTFFFSGGREAEFAGETRMLIPSPDVATYDLKPEMSAPELTEKLCAAIRGGEYDVIVCNYANGDMVGHTGVFDAAVKAAETVDWALGEIEQAVKDAGGHCLITADHGNLEQMHDASTGQAHTAHTSELVPLVYIGEKSFDFRSDGVLADIAPTLLDLMEIEQPPEMTGKSLVSA